jgi:Mannan-binding protein
MKKHNPLTLKTLILSVISLCISLPTLSATTCPESDFITSLGAQAASKSIVTTQPKTDCEFHQWSWETFVWATTMIDGKPRFMNLRQLSELTQKTPTSSSASSSASKLVLSTRSHENGTHEGAGAIVEADGNMLVAQNGYPVYASIHMNDSYFKTAKANLIVTGDYVSNPNQDDYFDVGAAVFKATWMRLDNIKEAPVGAFVTTADVPVLKWDEGLKNVVVDRSVPNVSVQVALVGLHVVGFTTGHPEFLWGTFEHNLNSPQIPDNTFCSPALGMPCSPVTPPNTNNYTFYQANTPYSGTAQSNSPTVNISNQANFPVLTFDVKTQKFSPSSNVVLLNKTGGESDTNGPANISNLNTSAQQWLNKKGPKKQKTFSNYSLIGTVWMNANTYVINPTIKPPQTQPVFAMNQVNAVGSLNLANSTAETFVQYPYNQNFPNINPGATPNSLANCFQCHNPQSYNANFSKSAPALPPRRIAISHVLSIQTDYDVANTIPAQPSSTPNPVPNNKICVDVKTATIQDNNKAKTICPSVCAGSLSFTNWNGNWTNKDGGAVCNCCFQ